MKFCGEIFFCLEIIHTFRSKKKPFFACNELASLLLHFFNWIAYTYIWIVKEDNLFVFLFSNSEHVILGFYKKTLTVSPSYFI